MVQMLLGVCGGSQGYLFGRMSATLGFSATARVKEDGDDLLLLLLFFFNLYGFSICDSDFSSEGIMGAGAWKKGIKSLRQE